MMWVVRAGRGSVYYEKIMNEQKIYIPWDGFCLDLSTHKTRSEFRSLVEKEKKTENRTSISTWAGQLFAFVWEIKAGDTVLIPSKASHTYCHARVSGDYSFDINEPDKLYHYRSIEIIKPGIPRSVLPQDLRYSLGAYRTIFRVKQEDKALKIIKDYKEQNLHG